MGQQLIQSKTDGQQNYIRSIVENDITFCRGLAGTGKTYVSCGLALEWLERSDKKIHKILLTRPIVHIGGGIGFFPGNRDEKSEEYLYPVIQTIIKIIGNKECKSLINQKKIEMLPLPLIRGISLDNYFVIADECQSATYAQIKCLLTRIGDNTKLVLNGDETQGDLPYKNCPFTRIANLLQNVDGIGDIRLGFNDIVRNGLIGKILRILVDE